MLVKYLNPRNRGKPKFKFLIRKLEDLIKNIFLSFLIFLSFFVPTKIREKKIINLQNYVDIYSINYIVFSLSKKYIFSYNLSSSLSLIKRLGVKVFFNSCKPNILLRKKKINVSYNKVAKLNNNELNFNFDYFLPFDENNFKEIENKKSVILPYYTRAEFYRKNYFEKFKKLRKNKKKFSIIFSGSNHPDWYEQFKWPINSNANENILTRCQILDFVKKEYSDDVQVIESRDQVEHIDYNKKILLFISDPSKKRRLSKILTMDQHMHFISLSKFFLTCPGTTMPLSHHLVESMFLGTVPISLYGNLLFPKLENNINSFYFKNFTELNHCVEKSLSISDDEHENIQNSVLEYYENHLSPSSFLNYFENRILPLNLYMNVDGHTLDSRRERFGLPRLFPNPKS